MAYGINPALLRYSAKVLSAT